MRSHNLPLGSGARHFHLTGSNSPTKSISRDLVASSAFYNEQATEQLLLSTELHLQATTESIT